jgi:hypothetical protein
MYFKAILEAFLTSQGYVDLSPVWGLFLFCFRIPNQHIKFIQIKSSVDYINNFHSFLMYLVLHSTIFSYIC